MLNMNRALSAAVSLPQLRKKKRKTGLLHYNIHQAKSSNLISHFYLTNGLRLFGPGFSRVPGPGGGSGGGGGVAAYKSKTISNGIVMNFGGLVQNHKLINLL